MRTTWIDSEAHLVGTLVAVMDKRLSDIVKSSVELGNAEDLGYFDACEHVIGLGFVACQTIMATICGGLGVEKLSALSLGPQHASGLSKVQILNHAANYWKHNNEWSIERPDRRRKSIEEAFGSLGLPIESDYPLMGILSKISDPDPPSLRAALQIIDQWKSDIINISDRK